MSNNSPDTDVSPSKDGGKFPDSQPSCWEQWILRVNFTAQEKQKMLLSSETGHFSLIRWDRAILLL